MEIQSDLFQRFSIVGSTIDSISLSLLLGLLGIAITIFTVIYSFMETAKQRKNDIGKMVSLKEETDPVLDSDLGFTIGYLKRMKKMNSFIIAIIIADILITVCYIVHMLLPHINVIWYIALISESLLFFGSLICLFIYLYQYFQRFKII